MFSFLKKNNSNDFSPTKEMVKAAIVKGIKIGLKRDEIIEMISLMDKKLSRKKVIGLVDKILKN